MTNSESLLDIPLLREIARRRARPVALLGAGVFLLALGFCLARVPCAFTSSVSVALQQVPGASGALASLAGLGGGMKTYVGVIRSQRFAQTAARAAAVQALFALPTEEDATELVQNAVGVEDRSDGLLYIHATLSAPPRFFPGRATKERRVRVATQQIAQSYARSLRQYLATTNTDRDAALLREAESQLKKARADYDASVGALTALARGASPSAAQSAPRSGSPAAALAGNVADAATGLQSLYLSRGQLEVEIRSAEATRAATRDLLDGPVENLAALPDEDPLLAGSRQQVRKAAAELQTLRIDLADDNPEVVAAGARLRVATDRLRRESRAVVGSRSSETIRLDALRARHAALTQQIAVAEKRFAAGRRTSATLEQMRSEVALRLEVLKTTASQFAALSVQTIAGDNQMDVIDAPRVPRFGRPGLKTLGAICFFVALFAVQMAIAIEYLWRLATRPAAPSGPVTLEVRSGDGASAGSAAR